LALHTAIILNYPTHTFKLAPLIREAASFLLLTCNQCADLFSYIHEILLQQPVLPQIKKKIPDAPALCSKTIYNRKGSQYVLFQTVTEQTEKLLNKENWIKLVPNLRQLQEYLWHVLYTKQAYLYHCHKIKQKGWILTCMKQLQITNFITHIIKQNWILWTGAFWRHTMEKLTMNSFYWGIKLTFLSVDT